MILQDKTLFVCVSAYMIIICAIVHRILEGRVDWMRMEQTEMKMDKTVSRKCGLIDMNSGQSATWRDIIYYL